VMVVGAEEMPAEVWALVCERLDTADLVHMSRVSWTLRGHVLSRLRHHAPFPSGPCPPLPWGLF
jgi:hypothetical protein